MASRVSTVHVGGHGRKEASLLWAIVNMRQQFTDNLAGLDHGVGHSLLVLCDANAPHGKKWNNFKVLENYLFNVSISLS